MSLRTPKLLHCALVLLIIRAALSPAPAPAVEHTIKHTSYLSKSLCRMQEVLETLRYSAALSNTRIPPSSLPRQQQKGMCPRSAARVLL